MSTTPKNNQESPKIIGSKPTLLSRRNKRIFVVIIGIILIAIGGYFVYAQVKQSMTAPTAVTTLPDGTTELPAVTVITKKAETIAKEKSAEDAVSYLQSEVTKSSNDVEKARLLSTLVVYASVDQSPAAQKTALEYQLESYQLEPNENSAGVLAGMYTRLGDKANAIKYYRLAIDEAKKSTTQGAGEEGGTSYRYYENQITYLESQP
jgi:hypothetical protein